MTTGRATLLASGVPVWLRWLFVAQIFTVFLTGVKLVPGIPNNFGPFEVIGGVLIVSFLVSHDGGRQGLRGHPVISIQALLCGLALLSLIWFQGPSVQLGVVQTLILFFQLLFVLVAFNFLIRYQISPEKLLRLVTYSALILGPWILIAGIASQGDIQVAGPFRNRAHMANYMLTAFWLVLLYNSWPGIAKRERLISYLALASTLYPIAVSGRRSVYLSLFIGLIGIGFSFLPAYRGRRRSAFTVALLVFAFVGAMYAIGPRWLPQLGFFQDRVAGIGDRLEMSVAESDQEADANFFELQRIGVFSAFRDYPVLGIGWGGFYKSVYSLTGHEVHSTPLRFLAELGVIGAALYTGLMGILLLGSVRIIALLRDSPYRTTAVILAVAIWSLSFSYVYNRHITERTFWLLLVFYLAFEAFARSVAWRARRTAARQRALTPRWSPDQVAAAVGLPRS